MPWQTEPRVPDLVEEPQYHWPAESIGLEENDLFGHLHERFNTTRIFIQAPESFHRDVSEIVRQADDKEHFYRLMEERKKVRLDQLTKAHTSITAKLGTGYGQLSEEQNFRMLRLGCDASFDSLLDFMASFLGQNRAGKAPYPGATPLVKCYRQNYIVDTMTDKTTKGETSKPASLGTGTPWHVEREQPLPTTENTGSPRSDTVPTTRLSSIPDDLVSTAGVPSPAISPQHPRSAKRRSPVRNADEEPQGSKRQRGDRPRRSSQPMGGSGTVDKNEDSTAAGVTPCSDTITVAGPSVRPMTAAEPSVHTITVAEPSVHSITVAEPPDEETTEGRAARTSGIYGRDRRAAVSQGKRAMQASKRQRVRLKKSHLRKSARLETKEGITVR
ncbi:hypothetical protein B0I35DRAFT_515361 [Stachybotrys elegans]|uniref:Uncharacterized protein n=1 Tax=Stachybotrys elegans TaxID=80388 RepID=A0A8K0SDG7_9HYPO|nr:hypothetical protein B0I35DRAFT_515361 [Stachybotrys elegans]